MAIWGRTLEELVTKPVLPQADFWRHKRVLVTGHTGFKGAWLVMWLKQMGADVTALALPPSTTPNLHNLTENAQLLGLDKDFVCDIRDEATTRRIISDSKPEVVFHLAAQALVRESYRQPSETFASNVMGTVNVLEALREIDSVRVAIMVTTDKVYENREWIYPYKEVDPLGGHDPYSASKAACELAIASYRSSYFAPKNIAVASARAGNVIGGGDWSADRLLPDIVRAWECGNVLEVRRPQATRPWQHVLEPLNAYLVLAERLWIDPALASAYNFGPEKGSVATVKEVVSWAQLAWGGGCVLWGDGHKGPHEAKWLALETVKAKTVLGIIPRWETSEAVRRTVEWYRALAEGAQAVDLCRRDISDFLSSHHVC